MNHRRENRPTILLLHTRVDILVAMIYLHCYKMLTTTLKLSISFGIIHLETFDNLLLFLFPLFFIALTYFCIFTFFSLPCFICIFDKQAMQSAVVSKRPVALAKFGKVERILHACMRIYVI